MTMNFSFSVRTVGVAWVRKEMKLITLAVLTLSRKLKNYPKNVSKVMEEGKISLFIPYILFNFDLISN